MSAALRNLGAAIAIATATIGGRRPGGLAAFEPATCTASRETRRAPIEAVRCYCPTCRRADVREAWGAWQMRLL